jgi:hypothetical protein
MLKKLPIRIDERRAIERRGLKRATPLLDASNATRESLLSQLLPLSAYVQDPTLSFWQTDDHQDTVAAILSGAGHLARQVNYKRKKQQ